jgi:hypothetical protein
MHIKWQAIIVCCVLFAGCDSDQAIIWSATDASPNGALIASAHTTQTGGPGTAFVGTEVILEQAKIANKIAILGFSNESAYPTGATAVKLHWLSNSHLDVTFKPGATIEFQAIKALGVTITTHEETSPHQ